MAAPDHIRQIYNSVEAIKRLSDQVIGIGPWGIGLDGLLAFIPGAGGIYGIGAGAYLVSLAVKAEAERATILKMVGYIAADTVIGAVPIAGDAVDIFFRAHMLAANALQADIERRHGPIIPDHPAKSSRMKKVGESSVAGAAAKRR